MPSCSLVKNYRNIDILLISINRILINVLCISGQFIQFLIDIPGSPGDLDLWIFSLFCDLTNRNVGKVWIGTTMLGLLYFPLHKLLIFLHDTLYTILLDSWDVKAPLRVSIHFFIIENYNNTFVHEQMCKT